MCVCVCVCVCVRTYVRTSVWLQAEPAHKICKHADRVYLTSQNYGGRIFLSRDCSLKSGRHCFCWPMPPFLHSSGLLSPTLKVCVCVCVCVCIYMCMYVCIYVFVYVYNVMKERAVQCSSTKSSLLTFHYRPLIQLYNNRLEPSILSPVHIDWRFYTVFTGRVMEGTQYNSERILRLFVCIVDLVLALDAICWLVMMAYVGAVYVCINNGFFKLCSGVLSVVFY